MHPAAELSPLWHPAMMSAKRSDWATPGQLFRFLDTEFHFTLDVCASRDNAKCDRYFTKEVDGLRQQWSGTCWLNPPYGRQIGDWVHKALQESKRGVTTVALLPSRTDTQWWHDYCLGGAAEIRFLRGRLSFDDHKRKRAPFPSAVVVFRGEAVRNSDAIAVDARGTQDGVLFSHGGSE